MKVKVCRRVATVGSHRGGVVRVDERLPKEFRQHTIQHEKLEDYLMRHKKLKYPKAHKIATAMEKQTFLQTKTKEEWKTYNSIVGGLVRANKK
jgi:hypothetical protein